MTHLKPVLMFLLGVICFVIVFNVVKSLVGLIISFVIVIGAVYGLYKVITYFNNKDGTQNKEDINSNKDSL